MEIAQTKNAEDELANSPEQEPQGTDIRENDGFQIRIFRTNSVLGPQVITRCSAL